MAESFNHFPEIAQKFQKAMKQVVKKTAFDLQAVAAISAPTDTGFLRNSIYVKTSNQSTYGQAHRMTASGKRRRIQLDTSGLLPEVESPPDEFTAYVAVGAFYGVYVNYGTRHMAAQPFLEPAVDIVQPSFEAALSAIESQLGGS